MLKRKIGVFICHCGGNIADYVDVEKVCAAAQSHSDVAVAKCHMFTCSDAAQQEMIDDIQNEKLDGLVIASCSPKLHMYTFRGMAERAGINPYQYVQVNLREQCSWAHTDDQAGATEKGIRLVQAGIAKCRLSTPLSALRVGTIPKTLVVGAGVAGLRAALALSDLGLSVFLIEKEPEVGGWVGRLGTMFPTNRRGGETISHLLGKVRERENITLFTSAQLVEKSGSLGDFNVRIEIQGQDAVSLNVGAIVVATGFDVYRPGDKEYGYGGPGVVTLPEFRELVDGSEKGLVYNGKPVETIVYIYCVGSRQTSEDCENPNKYCSRYCCSAGVHTATLVHDRAPTVKQFHLFRDMRTYGKSELIYEEARNKGSLFIRRSDDFPITVEQGATGLSVKVKDDLTGGEELEIDADLVVLVTGMVPRDNPQLVNALKLPLDKDGFFNEIHMKLRPVETVIDGVFIAGACQSPKTAAESVGAALAAVSKGAALLMKGYVDLEPLIARVDPDRCVWCDACTEACPYEAVERATIGGKEVAVITKSLCKGEGACVPVCPTSAIDVEGYTDGQVTEMIEALAREVTV
jgi:heterodisulfide reductase subunit A2